MRSRRGLLRLGLATAVLAVAGCGSDRDERQGASRQAVAGPSPEHVHGLGVNPRDGALFVASHTGLFRAGRSEQRLRRVGDRMQDTMGFTVVGADRFLGSGHPDLRDDLPPFLGLIRSADAGRSWRAVSLTGEADFHVLEAQGRRVYGFGSDWDSRAEQFLASSDGGRSWRKRDLPEPVIGLATRPGQALTLLASGQRGLHLSRDGGSSWTAVAGAAGLPSWPTAEALYVMGLDGELRVSANAGRTWRGIGNVGGQPVAFEATSPATLYAALHDATIKYSTDGGATWRLRARP